MHKSNNPIRLFRVQNGMTLEQLAALIGVSAAAVSRWETGARVPDAQYWPAIEAATGIVVSARDFRRADREGMAFAKVNDAMRARA